MILFILLEADKYDDSKYVINIPIQLQLNTISTNYSLIAGKCETCFKVQRLNYSFKPTKNVHILGRQADRQTYIQTDIKRDKTDRLAGRQTDRQANRQTDRHLFATRTLTMSQRNSIKVTRN